MAFIDSGNDALTQSLLQLAAQITQRKQFQQEQQRLNVNTLLSQLDPGTRVGDIPGLAELYQRTFHKPISPDTVIKPETTASALAKAGGQRFKSLPADQQTALADTALAVQSTAQAGASTPKQVQTEQGTGQIRAETQGTAAGAESKVVGAGAASIANKSPEDLAAAGESAILGGQMLNEFNARNNGAQLKSLVTTTATNMLKDPNGAGAALDKDLKDVGISGGLQEAASSGVLGVDDFLKMKSNFFLTARDADRTMDQYYVALATRYGVTPQQIKLATDVVNGQTTLPPEQLAALTKETWFKRYLAGQSAAQEGFFNEGMKDNSLAQSLNTLTMVLAKDPTNVSLINQIEDLRRKMYGEAIATKLYGPKSESPNPDAWQATADSVAQASIRPTAVKRFMGLGRPGFTATAPIDTVPQPYIAPGGQDTLNVRGLSPDQLNAITNLYRNASPQ